MQVGRHHHARDIHHRSPPSDLRETVRAKYAAQARRVTESASSCCEPSCCGGTATADPITGRSLRE